MFSRPDHLSPDEATDLMRRTEEIEAEKEARRMEREERKREKDRAKRRQFLEKLVAPFILLLSIVLSLGFLWFRQ